MEDSHAEENVVLWTDSQTLSDGAKLGPDVSAQDVGSSRGRREEAGKDGPAGRSTKMIKSRSGSVTIYAPVY